VPGENTEKFLCSLLSDSVSLWLDCVASVSSTMTLDLQGFLKVRTSSSCPLILANPREFALTSRRLARISGLIFGSKEALSAGSNGCPYIGFKFRCKFSGRELYQ